MGFETTMIFSSESSLSHVNGNKAEDFTVIMTPPIVLDIKKKYKMALLNLTGAYSWRNITAANNNNIIRYSTNSGEAYNTITFNDGIYSYSDINNYIHAKMKINGDYTVVSGVDTFGINIIFDINTFLVYIELEETYYIDLYTQQFANLIGFNTGIKTTSSLGAFLPNITNSIDNILLHCSLVKDSIFNGVSSNTLFSYSTSTLNRSYSYAFEPINLSWLPLNGNSLSSIRFYITDVNGKIINLNNIHVVYTIQIKEDI